MITETSLVSAVVRRMVADSSRIVATKTKHQAVITLVRKSGVVISHKARKCDAREPRGSEKPGANVRIALYATHFEEDA
jgi:hypothetical protein